MYLDESSIIFDDVFMDIDADGGGTCVLPDDGGWGTRLENYGYCSCTSQ